MLVTRTICEHCTVERWNKARTVRNYSVAGLSGARLRSKKIIRVSMISAPCAPCSCICGRNVGKSCSRWNLFSWGNCSFAFLFNTVIAYRVEFEALWYEATFIVIVGVIINPEHSEKLDNVLVGVFERSVFFLFFFFYNVWISEFFF